MEKAITTNLYYTELKIKEAGDIHPHPGPILNNRLQRNKKATNETIEIVSRENTKLIHCIHSKIFQSNGARATLIRDKTE